MARLGHFVNAKNKETRRADRRKKRKLGEQMRRRFEQARGDSRERERAKGREGGREGVGWRCEVGLVWIVRLVLLVREVKRQESPRFQCVVCPIDHLL